MCIKDAIMGQKGVAHSTKIRITELYMAFICLGYKKNKNQFASSVSELK